jgi:hypothetical protein
MWQPSRLIDRHRNGWTDITRLKIALLYRLNASNNIQNIFKTQQLVGSQSIFKFRQVPRYTVTKHTGGKYGGNFVRKGQYYTSLFHTLVSPLPVTRQEFLWIWHAGRIQVPISFNTLLIFRSYLSLDPMPGTMLLIDYCKP